MTDKRQCNVYLPEDLVLEVKLAAVRAEARLSAFVEAALRAHLARLGRPPGKDEEDRP